MSHYHFNLFKKLFFTRNNKSFLGLMKAINNLKTKGNLFRKEKKNSLLSDVSVIEQNYIIQGILRIFTQIVIIHRHNLCKYRNEIRMAMKYDRRKKCQIVNWLFNSTRKKPDRVMLSLKNILYTSIYIIVL